MMSDNVEDEALYEMWETAVNQEVAQEVDEEEEPEPLMVNLYEVVDGQGEIETCTCGESITEYDGEWYHIFNPALTGADDHTASPD